MKRKVPDNVDIPTAKKSKQQEHNQDSYNKSVFERRRQEIFEIVSEENILYKPHKHDLGVVYEDGSSSNETEGSLEQIKISTRNLISKEKQKVIEQCKIISRAKAKNALCVLEDTIKRPKKKLDNETKRLNILEKHCSKNMHWQEEREHTWDSSMYIIKSIRACILTSNWNNLTHLLLMLVKYKRRYISYAKQVALLNLMNHPLDYNGEILEELHKLCMIVSAPK